MTIQGWFLLGFNGWLSLLSKELSRILSTIIWKHQFFNAQSSLWSNSHIHTWPLEKPKLWLNGPCWQSDVLLFNMLSRFIITFLPRSKHCLISWLESLSTVILEPNKMKSITAFTLEGNLKPAKHGSHLFFLDHVKMSSWSKPSHTPGYRQWKLFCSLHQPERELFPRDHKH